MAQSNRKSTHGLRRGTLYVSDHFLVWQNEKRQQSWGWPNKSCFFLFLGESRDDLREREPWLKGISGNGLCYIQLNHPLRVAESLTEVEFRQHIRFNNFLSTHEQMTFEQWERIHANE